MATCENCGDPCCAANAEQCDATWQHVAECQRRAKERALAEVARLTAGMAAWRMELHRWMQSPTPCPPYLPALAPALEKLDETIDSLKTVADIRWRDLEAARATLARVREACQPECTDSALSWGRFDNDVIACRAVRNKLRAQILALSEDK